MKTKVPDAENYSKGGMWKKGDLAYSLNFFCSILSTEYYQGLCSIGAHAKKKKKFYIKKRKNKEKEK